MIGHKHLFLLIAFLSLSCDGSMPKEVTIEQSNIVLADPVSIDASQCR